MGRAATTCLIVRKDGSEAQGFGGCRLATIALVGWLWAALLACAVLLVIGAEWPRLSGWLGVEARRNRERARRKANMKLVRTESDEFAASVQRDLADLPTIEEHDRRR